MVVALGVLLLFTGDAPPLVGAAVGAGGAWSWRWADRRVARARSGLIGERLVARHLRRFGVVIHGWVPPGRRGDVDVVVLAPCVAAVEVKRAEGKVRARGDSVLVGGRPLPGAPLRQAVSGAVAVRAALDSPVPVHAVLCVTGMTQRPRVMSSGQVPVVVCSARHLKRVLRRLDRDAVGTVDERVRALEMA